MRPSRATTTRANPLMLLEPIHHRPVAAEPPHASATELAARRIEFHDRAVTAVHFRGRWAFRAAEVGLAIGYAEGARLVDKIRDEWADEFTEGRDYDLLRGALLKEFKRLSPESGDSAPDRSPALLVLYERGIDRALILARTPRGRELRDLLVDHVLPQLRATGTATLPGAPAPGLDPEKLRAMIAETVADQLRTLLPAALSSDQPILGDSDLGTVLMPLRRLALKVAGAGAAARVVARSRGRIEQRVRRALGWEARWCLFPRARLGELLAALQVETRLADELAEALADARQGSLRSIR